MRVCVIGTGYVGLVTGVSLAKIGHDVICIDNNEEKVKLMQSGESPIFEPGLSELMRSAIDSNKIQFSTDLRMGGGTWGGFIHCCGYATTPKWFE